MEGIVAPYREESPSNNFKTLCTLEDPQVSTKDRDQQPLFTAIEEVNVGILLDHLGSLARVYSPSYVDMIRNKPLESSGSSEDETFERHLKKAGRKYLKEAREEEAKRQKMQGIQTTL